MADKSVAGAGRTVRGSACRHRRERRRPARCGGCAVTTLTGRLVRLEPLAEQHAAAVVEAVRSSPPEHFALGATPPPDLEAVREWIATAQADGLANGTKPFATIRIGNGPDRLVG